MKNPQLLDLKQVQDSVPDLPSVACLADPFAAAGAVLTSSGGGGASLRLYVVLQDNTAFLLLPKASGVSDEIDHSVFAAVPAWAQPAIRGAHPNRELRFPSDPAPANARYANRWSALRHMFHVDPKKINLLPSLSRDGQKSLMEMNGEILDGDWDLPQSERFENLDIHKALRERLLLGAEWETTAFYARVAAEIDSGNRKWGCGDMAQFRARCEKLEELFYDIKKNGYKSQQTLRQQLRDEVRVGIDRNGRFIFLDGRHRLSIARLLELREIPVRIVVRHRIWEDFKERIKTYAREHGGRIYQLIDHPDLADIPAQHGTDRIDLLKGALDGYPCTGKRLLDIGAHWGYMSQQMEKAGFLCTAVERNRQNAEFADKIRLATESQFAVWRGDIFSFPETEKQDVVLALNIFHHLTKTEELHAGLIAFLQKLRADIILFEPHISDPPGQMANAYRNYNPQEFAEFVARHARLQTIIPLGRAKDGRPLFKITR